MARPAPCRGGRLLPALAALALLAASIGAHAAIRWTSTTAVTLSAAPPPVRFVAGPGSERERFIDSFEASPDGTSFEARIDARSGGLVHVKDVARLEATTANATLVALTGSRVLDPGIEEFAWTIRNGSRAVAVLDHRAVSPEAGFTLPGGATYTLDLRIDVADGGGRHDAAPAFSLEVRPS